jgi:hypothetical protein
MSEKRQRQQQRRRRRKAQRADRAWDAPRSAKRSAARGIASKLAEVAEIAARHGREPDDALEAEQWASCLIATMDDGVMPAADAERALVPALVIAIEGRGGEGALATLRALGAVLRPEDGRLARAAADRLAATGVPEPAWVGDLGQARPTAAALISEGAFDDGAGVLVEFAARGSQPHTVAVFIDHNLGGLAKHVLLAGPLAEMRRAVERDAAAAADGGIAIRDLDFAEARARIASALDALDHTYGPPIGEHVVELRAFLEARLGALPDGFALPPEDVPPGREEREALLADFLASPEGERWRSDDLAADVVELAIDFGSDYNHGGPLRWSPVVVDIFMTDWLPRKVLHQREFFEHVPVVLGDWVGYAGRRRGVPARLIGDAADNVATCRDPMLEAVDDSSGGGPAVALAQAALDAGVDLSDPEELERFLGRYNGGLAA